jgi:flagella basal body P-ring formation protein FlgA
MSTMGTAATFARGVMAIFAVALFAVAARADVQVLPVPKIVIYPGDIISEQSLMDRAFNANWSAKLPVHKTKSDMIGKVARRTLVPGQPVPISATHVADAVTQGKTYRIEYREDGLIISGSAVAMSSGAIGDVVSLRNPDSGIVIHGIVDADGKVRMGAR